MSTETYSLSADFGGNLDSYQFHLEVQNEGSITPNIQRVDVVGDVVDVVFDSALSAGEQTTLNGLVTAHVPNPKTYDRKLIKISLETTDLFLTGSSYYKTMRTSVRGETLDPINKITVLSNMDSSITNYSVRIYDITNSNIIGENTFTNTSISLNEITPLSNLPTDAAVFEVHIKRNGGNKNTAIYLYEATIEYGGNI